VTAQSRHGSVSVELLTAMPLVLLGISGLVQFFTLHLARQRTYAALPEVASSMAEQGTRTVEFWPHGEARCRAEGKATPLTTGLSPAEVKVCRKAGYDPVSRLRRILLNAETTLAGLWLPGLPQTLRIRVPYRGTFIERS